MRILRGIQPIAKVTAVFVLAVVTASSLVVLSPRSTSAEGFLLGTVRCLVRSLLTGECQKAASPAQPTTTAPDPAQPPASEPAQQPQPAEDASKPALSPVKEPDFAPIEVPEPQHIAPVSVVDAGMVSNTRIPESEFVAYFNAYSPYAVQGAQQVSTVPPIERSSEGWRLFGIAWYVWAGFLVLAIGGFATVKYGFLRRKSVLSKGG